LFDKAKIEAMEEEHKQAPHLRVLQKALAKDITVRVHSEEDYNSAIKASEILFGNSATDELKSIDESTLLSVFEGVPQVNISTSEFKNALTITDLLSVVTKSEIFPSKGEARKMISGGGVYVNKNKVNSPDQKVEFELLQEKYLLVQKGKKNYFLVKVSE
jgi:tyrosyl-tRNA synthetase